MNCKCGYRFSKPPTGRRRKHDSFAVINDRNYPAYLKSEQRVARARSETGKLKAIAASSVYVGCLLECPECSRLLLLKPNDSSPEEKHFYVKEP